MLTLATWTSIALYLLPIVVVLAARARSDQQPAQIALDLTLAVALDLLAILLVSRIVRLEIATLVVRGLWLVGGLVLIWRRRKRWRGFWPSRIGLREVLVVAGTATGAVLVSLRISRPCAIWDRQWHIPLVGSLRGQRAPFANVFEPNGKLHYHYAGDVLASVFQTLSFDAMHASLALSIAHDVIFGLCGAAIALLLIQLRFRRFAAVLGVLLGTLLVGPALILREGSSRLEFGISVINYLSLSFRPHVPLASLLTLGFAGSTMLRDHVGRWKVTRAWPALLVCTALLVVADEASLGVVGLGFGAAWLVDRRLLSPKPWVGAAVLGGLLIVIVASRWLLGGTLSQGAPEQALTLAAWRIPGFYQPSIPLEATDDWILFLIDLWPILLVSLAGLIAALRSKSKTDFTMLAFSGVMTAVSIFLYAKLDIGGSGLNSHRFVTAAFFLSPLMGAYWIASECRRLGVTRGAGSLVSVLVYLAIGLASATTVEWVRGIAERVCWERKGFFGVDPFYETDCRTEARARLFQKTVPTYIDESIWYLYSGCRPVFAPGPPAGQDGLAVKVGIPTLGLAALEELHRDMVSADTPLALACAEASGDGVCAASPTCFSLGPKVNRCWLPKPEREKLLDHH